MTRSASVDGARARLSTRRRGDKLRRAGAATEET